MLINDLVACVLRPSINHALSSTGVLGGGGYLCRFYSSVILALFYFIFFIFFFFLGGGGGGGGGVGVRFSIIEKGLLEITK